MQLLDYGVKVEVHRNNLRYLHRKFLSMLPSQSIRCTVRYPNRDLPWRNDEGKLLEEMTRGKMLAVHFKKKNEIDVCVLIPYFFKRNI